MQKQEFKNAVASAIAAGIVFFAGILALGISPTSGQMKKEEVQAIVSAWIKENPQAILDAVNEYQQTGSQKQQAEALRRNNEFIFNDPGSPVAGNEEGDITIVEFFDYNCGYCKHMLPVVQEILKKDSNVRFVFKDFPILGPTSKTAAQWALAAHKQGKYFAFYTALMEHKGQFDEATLKRLAEKTGLDVARAQKDAASPEVQQQIDRDLGLAHEMGLNGTPAFIVGDMVLPGAVDLAALEAKIAEARARKKEGASKQAPSDKVNSGGDDIQGE